MNLKGKTYYKSYIGFVLLFLFSLRIIPFGTLHYHTSQAKDLNRYSISMNLESNENALMANLPLCSFDNYLSLIENGFIQFQIPKVFTPSETAPRIVDTTELSAQGICLILMNKGSPA